MPRHVIVPARYEQGLSTYRSGGTLRELMRTAGEIEAMHEQPDLSNEQHEEIANGAPSLITGFADGLIEDIRHIASSRRGQTA